VQRDAARGRDVQGNGHGGRRKRAAQKGEAGGQAEPGHEHVQSALGVLLLQPALAFGR